MKGNSPTIVSNQATVHERLEQFVQHHMEQTYLKPVSTHTLLAFEQAQRVCQSAKSIVLDSGCGVGDSTYSLARQYPDSLVIGLDKSAARLGKSGKNVSENVLFLQADQFDFWRLVAASGWKILKHYIFYPNPWPKKAHVKRRIYGHPAFVILPAVTKNIEIRSNWLIYLQEFSRAWFVLTAEELCLRTLEPVCPISLFEKKFQESGHPLYKLANSEERQ